MYLYIIDIISSSLHCLLLAAPESCVVSVSSCFKKFCLANDVSEHEKQQFMCKCRLLNDIKPLLETLPRILRYSVLGPSGFQNLELPAFSGFLICFAKTRFSLFFSVGRRDTCREAPGVVPWEMGTKC